MVVSGPHLPASEEGEEVMDGDVNEEDENGEEEEENEEESGPDSAEEDVEENGDAEEENSEPEGIDRESALSIIPIPRMSLCKAIMQFNRNT